MSEQQMRPASNKQAPDPTNTYERAHPEREAGMGRLDNNIATPTDRPDQPEDAVANKQEPRQINTHEITDARSGSTPTETRQPSEQTQQPEQPDHSMHDEEPMGWDQAPTDIHNPRHKRHPRKEGKGGVK